MMNIEDWIREAKRRVDGLEAELIALKAFAPVEVDRSWLVAHGKDVALNYKVAFAEELLAHRLLGAPLAYVLGEKEFYGRYFSVKPGVLIPRVETETLIDLVKGLKLPARAQMLEVGTGSGCIAITLALEFPQAFVVATDVSEEALEQATLNDDRHEGRVEFYHSDLLKDLPDEATEFDVLVANLPYVDENWDWLDREALDFEPPQALYAGDGGLAVYKKLIQQLRDKVAGVSARYVVLEADPSQHEDLVRFAEENGLRLLKTEGFGLAFEAV